VEFHAYTGCQTRLTIGLTTGCIHDTAVCTAGYQSGCQTGCQTGCTTGWKPVVSCKQGIKQPSVSSYLLFTCWSATALTGLHCSGRLRCKHEIPELNPTTCLSRQSSDIQPWTRGEHLYCISRVDSCGRLSQQPSWIVK